MAEKFDLAVIGAGPGGYVAAIRAAQLGLNVAVIEREQLGGICLNWGCIPTKALLRSAEMIHYAKNMEEFGIKVGKIEFDLTKIINRSREVAAQLSKGIKGLLAKNKVSVINGHAKIIAPGKLEVQDGNNVKTIYAKDVIIATGARAREIAGAESDGDLIWTYKHAMTPKTLPKSLVIIGSGAIGVEFASIYNALGVEVTVIEMQDRIMPNEDTEISQFARKSFEEQGIKFLTSTALKGIKKGKGCITATIRQGEKESELKAEKAIVAIGIVANIENIGLEKVSIKTEKGHIVTDKYCQSSAKNIYAIGDVTKGPWLAHKASHEGIICAEKIAGKKPHIMNENNIPACTYSIPQIASVGLTEDEAKQQGYSVKVGRFSAIANGKAIAMGETKGLTKTIFDAKTGELLGAHMIGAEVTEMIQGYIIGKNMEGTEEDFINTIFPHPTLSEMMHESVLSAFNRAIHM